MTKEGRISLLLAGKLFTRKWRIDFLISEKIKLHYFRSMSFCQDILFQGSIQIAEGMIIVTKQAFLRK
jgi:hypothetical protein